LTEHQELIKHPEVSVKVQHLDELLKARSCIAMERDAWTADPLWDSDGLGAPVLSISRVSCFVCGVTFVSWHILKKTNSTLSLHSCSKSTTPLKHIFGIPLSQLLHQWCVAPPPTVVLYNFDDNESLTAGFSHLI